MCPAIDELQVRYPPKSEQVRPGQVTVIAPHTVEWHSVVDLGILEQARPILRTPPPLQPRHHTPLGNGCSPELPCGDAASVPPRPPVERAVPGKIAVPAQI